MTKNVFPSLPSATNKLVCAIATHLSLLPDIPVRLNAALVTNPTLLVNPRRSFVRNLTIYRYLLTILRQAYAPLTTHKMQHLHACSRCCYGRTKPITADGDDRPERAHAVLSPLTHARLLLMLSLIVGRTQTPTQVHVKKTKKRSG